MPRSYPTVLRWILAALLASFTSPVVGGCGCGDRKVGEKCKRKSDCESDLFCLKPPKGPGACTRRCGPPENPPPRPGQKPGRLTAGGPCDGETRCLRVKVEVQDPGCNRTYRGSLEANYCVVPDQVDAVFDGKRFQVSLK